MDKKQLQHYGTLGMKWGFRKQKEHTSTRKEKILADPRKLYKHRHNFSDEEIRSAMKKIELEQSLHKMATTKREAGIKYAKGVMDSIGVVKKAALLGISAAVLYKAIKSVKGEKVITEAAKKAKIMTAVTDFLKTGGK